MDVPSLLFALYFCRWYLIFCRNPFLIILYFFCPVCFWGHLSTFDQVSIAPLFSSLHIFFFGYSIIKITAPFTFLLLFFFSISNVPPPPIQFNELNGAWRCIIQKLEQHVWHFERQPRPPFFFWPCEFDSTAVQSLWHFTKFEIRESQNVSRVLPTLSIRLLFPTCYW